METFDNLHKALQDLSNQNIKVEIILFDNYLIWTLIAQVVGDDKKSEVCDNSIVGSAECVKTTTENIKEPEKDDTDSSVFSLLFSFFG